MNNIEFRQHFINALQQFHIMNYEDTIIIIEPIYEKEKWTSQTYDEIMRLQILPKKRTVSFGEALKLFTFWEGYYPCWINIEMVDSKIHLKTSLRMRKVNSNNDRFFYPFRISCTED